MVDPGKKTITEDLHNMVKQGEIKTVSEDLHNIMNRGRTEEQYQDQVKIFFINRLSAIENQLVNLKEENKKLLEIIKKHNEEN